MSSTTSPLLGAYTHLKNDASVLVTAWERVGTDSFTLDVRWPAFEGDLPYDPRILAQTIRQSGLVIAHAEYDVPLHHQTVLNTLDITVDPEFRAPVGRSSALDVEVNVSQTQRGSRATSALRMDLHILRDGVAVARADSEFAWIAPPVYRRLRGEYLTVDWGSWPVPAPVAPELAGRTSVDQVVLSPGDRPNRWLLRNDPANALLFDHPADHVPGLALLEAADQSAHALLAPISFTPARIATRYARYVEFGQPCQIEANLLPTPGPGRVALRVFGVQGGEQMFTVDFEGVAS